MLPENFPISSEMRKVLEQHLQERFIHPLWELPGKIRKTLERVRLQGELPAKSQTQKPHRPSRTIRFPHESSPDAQKVELWCSQHLGRGPRGFMGRVPEDLSRGSGSPLMRLQAVSSEESERNLRLPRHNLLGELDKSVENIPKRHPRRTPRKTGEGLSSVSEHTSRLADSFAFPKLDTHPETGNRGDLKGWKPRVNTCHGTPFLELDTREMLEAHTTRFWAKHRWRALFKVLKAVNIFNLKKALPLPILHLTSPPPVTCVSGIPAIVKFPDYVGKPLQAFPGETVETEESSSTVGRPPLAPPLVCADKVWGGSPFSDDHRRPKSCPTGQEGRQPIHHPTLNTTGRTWQNGTGEQDQRGAPELGPCSAKARDELRKDGGGRASQDPCRKVTALEPQYVGVVTAMGNSKPESVGFATPVGNFKPQSVRVATPMGNSKPQYVGVATTMGNAKLQYIGITTSMDSLATESHENESYTLWSPSHKSVTARVDRLCHTSQANSHTACGTVLFPEVSSLGNHKVL
ncbi:putative spermatogenesis-associated protein 31C2 [Manis pentadactyla]|uniref:putative spermatogenesis-associated protein 31C2 n=1 Tax=Manis pentadactyla TaxID=143292 RepID=UPI00255CE1ED|nr:putative spermatogenesis-associated protein 31C2 [Manis pentadactyla]